MPELSQTVTWATRCVRGPPSSGAAGQVEARRGNDRPAVRTIVESSWRPATPPGPPTIRRGAGRRLRKAATGRRPRDGARVSARGLHQLRVLLAELRHGVPELLAGDGLLRVPRTARTPRSASDADRPVRARTLRIDSSGPKISISRRSRFSETRSGSGSSRARSRASPSLRRSASVSRVARVRSAPSCRESLARSATARKNSLSSMRASTSESGDGRGRHLTHHLATIPRPPSAHHRLHPRTHRTSPP